MSTSFPCSKCAAPLVSSDTSGPIICPVCGVESSAPAQAKPPIAFSKIDAAQGPHGEPAVAEVLPDLPPSEQATNPYAPSASYAPDDPPSHYHSTVGLKHSLLRFERLWSTTYRLMSGQFGPFLLFGVMLTFAYMGLGIATSAVQESADKSGDVSLVVITFLGAQGVNLAGQAYLQLVSCAFCIRFAREGKADWNAVGVAGKSLLGGFLIQLIVWLVAFGLSASAAFVLAALGYAAGVRELYWLFLAAGIGMALVAYFVVLLNLYLSFYFLVDRGLTTTAAMKASARFMRGNKLPMFLVLLVVYLGGALFTLVTFGIGIFILVPFFQLLSAVAYLQATGQSTFEPKDPYPAVFTPPASA